MAGAADGRNGVRVTGAKTIRLGIALLVLAATGLLAASALATSHAETSLQSLNRQVLVAVNRFRVEHGLSALSESGGLDSSACQHSFEMGRFGYFAHPSHDGAAFWKRIRHYYPAKGDPYWSVGENLVWRDQALSAGQAMKLWIASPPHLKNLLTPQWRRIGISAVRVAHARGVFGGSTIIIITTDFGVRR